MCLSTITLHWFRFRRATGASGSERSSPTISSTTGTTALITRSESSGPPCRPSPERGLQSLDRAAAAEFGRPARLDFLPADGGRGRASGRIRRGRPDRPPLPVLDPYRTRRQAWLVRSRVRFPSTIGSITGSTTVISTRITVASSSSGTACSAPRGRGRAAGRWRPGRARHVRSHLRQPRLLPDDGRPVPPGERLARQDPRLVRPSRRGSGQFRGPAPLPRYNPKAAPLYDPPASRAASVIALAALVAMIGATAAFLLAAPHLPLANGVVVFLSLAAALWALGSLLDGRISIGEALYVFAAASTCAAYALDWPA